MNSNVKFRIICTSAMVIVVMLLQRSQAALGQEGQNAKTNHRQHAHKVLFDQFVSQEKCKWTDGDSVLKEVVVFEGSSSIDGVEVLKLPEKSNLVAGLFDRVVVRGENLTELESVGFVVREEVLNMHLGSKLKEDECVLRMAVVSREFRETKESELQCASKSKLKITEVAFQSVSGIDKDYVTFRKRRRAKIPRGKGADLEFAAMAEIEGKNLEELAVALGENSEAFLRLVLMARMSAGVDDITILSVLADRKVSRMHELLSELPPKKAAELSLANFEREFTSFKKFYENAEMAPVNIPYALEANMFLCSEFCPSKEVVEAVDSWAEWHSGLVKTKGSQFRIMAAPDPLLVSNLYMNMLMRERKMTMPQANIWLRESFSEVVPYPSMIPQLKSRWLMASNWNPQQMDAIKAVPVFESYDFLNVENRRALVIGILKAELISP